MKKEQWGGRAALMIMTISAGLLPVSAQCPEVYNGQKLAVGLEMGVASSSGKTDYVTTIRAESGESIIRMAYPASHAWGAVFITVGPPTNVNRPYWNLSACNLLSIEMKGASGGETIDIGLKTNSEPDLGLEKKIRVGLSREWKTYYFSVDRFAPTDPGRLYVVTEFVFDGPTAETVEFRTIRYSQSDNSKRSFSVLERGGAVFSAAGETVNTTLGYSQIQTDAGKAVPSAFALYKNSRAGVPVSVAAVPASPLVRSGRSYVDISGAANTGIAIANPNNAAANVDYYFTNASGEDFGHGRVIVPPNGQIAQFLNEAPFGAPPFQGSFTFSSNLPIGVVTIRGYTNERGEFLITTLPTVALGSNSTAPVTVPHYGVGGGWSTQILLVNPTDSPISGTAQFFNAAGAPVTVNIGGQNASSFIYSVPRRSSSRLVTSPQGTTASTGALRITPTAGASPVPLVLFSFIAGGVTVTETGVPARQGNAFRTFAEATGRLDRVGSMQTGLAIANTGTAPATVTIEATRLDGTSAVASVTKTIPVSGQIAQFIQELFPGLAMPFQGILRVSSSNSAVSMIGLRAEVNARSDFLVAATPVTDEAASVPGTELFVPHLAVGGGYSIQFFVFSKAPGTSSGLFRMFDQSGSALDLDLH